MARGETKRLLEDLREGPRRYERYAGDRERAVGDARARGLVDVDEPRPGVRVVRLTPRGASMLTTGALPRAPVPWGSRGYARRGGLRAGSRGMTTVGAMSGAALGATAVTLGAALFSPRVRAWLKRVFFAG